MATDPPAKECPTASSIPYVAGENRVGYGHGARGVIYGPAAPRIILLKRAACKCECGCQDVDCPSVLYYAEFAFVEGKCLEAEGSPVIHLKKAELRRPVATEDNGVIAFDGNVRGDLRQPVITILSSIVNLIDGVSAPFCEIKGVCPSLGIGLINGFDEGILAAVPRGKPLLPPQRNLERQLLLRIIQSKKQVLSYTCITPPVKSQFIPSTTTSDGVKYLLGPPPFFRPFGMYGLVISTISND